MKIIGVGFLSESSVALIENGKVIYAISEERLNRIKNWWGNPYKTIEFVLKKTKYKVKDIDYFSTNGLSSIKNDIPNLSIFQKKIIEVENSKLKKNIKIKQVNFLKKRIKHEIKARNRVLRNLSSLKKKYKKVEIHDHHKAHASSAYFFSGWNNCHVLTIDGWGDHSSSKLYHVSNGKFKELSNSYTVDSLGYFYGSITKLLGFKPHRHEGKILGLAAFGNPHNAYDDISKMISYDYKNNCFKGNYEKGLYIAKFKNPNLKFLLKRYSREDIAAATQKRIEEVIIKFLKKNIVKKTKLALAGGVFANVKINQKISNLKNIEKIFVYPNMGDGGLSVGSAALSYFNHGKLKSKKISDVYLGPKYSNKEVLKEIKKSKLKYVKFKDPAKFIAKKLSEGFVVGCFQGRMEFGPRALGNRSILVHAKDKSVNDWLNKKLKRTEFMPFAPITLKNKAHEMYSDLGSKYISTKFMTVTCNCKKKMIKISPAAVHVDDTARPQLIDKKDNFKIYDILNKYYKKTKIPNLINTSFNVHEEPIVCTPNDAIRAFKTSKLDYLYIESYIVFNK